MTSQRVWGLPSAPPLYPCTHHVHHPGANPPPPQPSHAHTHRPNPRSPAPWAAFQRLTGRTASQLQIAIQTACSRTARRVFCRVITLGLSVHRVPGSLWREAGVPSGVSSALPLPFFALLFFAAFPALELSFFTPDDAGTSESRKACDRTNHRSARGQQQPGPTRRAGMCAGLGQGGA